MLLSVSLANREGDTAWRSAILAPLQAIEAALDATPPVNGVMLGIKRRHCGTVLVPLKGHFQTRFEGLLASVTGAIKAFVTASFVRCPVQSHAEFDAVVVDGVSSPASFEDGSNAATDAAAASSISANVNNIPMLNGTNFKKWKEHVIIVLGCMDVDYALRVDHPSDLTSASTIEQRSTMEKWERSNRMSLMIMKHSIPEAIRGAILEETQNQGILGPDSKPIHKETKRLRQAPFLHIMEMSNLVTRLKALKLELSKDILVHLVLISLPTQFSPFKISYNTQKEKWTLNELIAQFGFGANKKRKRDNKGKQATVSETSKQKVQKKQDKDITCFFCKKAGHMKKTCTKYAAWREKKATLLNFVCSEINLVVVPTDTWWIDTGATTHISVTMQGCLRSQMPNDGNFKVEVENQLSKKLKAVRSDHGGEYYGRYDGSGEQHPGPFAKYLMECGIVPQCTMSGTPSQNGVAERQNCTFKDMVRSMISHSTLPESFGEKLSKLQFTF
ncbi:hypothetical protein AAG906_021246 [Vitis piasezkii]